MTGPLNDHFAFERLSRRIDDPMNKAVVVVIVNSDETIDTASVGIDNAVGLWSVFFSLAAQLSDEVMASFTEEQKASARIVVPSMEQAREMGILRPFRPRS
jgi:hypothetical protein